MSKALDAQLLDFGIAVKPEPDMRPAFKPAIDWNKRLPRAFAEALSMPIDHPDRAGFIESTAAEMRSICEMVLMYQTSARQDPNEDIQDWYVENSLREQVLS